MLWEHDVAGSNPSTECQSSNPSSRARSGQGVHRRPLRARASSCHLSKLSIDHHTSPRCRCTRHRRDGGRDRDQAAIIRRQWEWIWLRVIRGTSSPVTSSTRGRSSALRPDRARRAADATRQGRREPPTPRALQRELKPIWKRPQLERRFKRPELGQQGHARRRNHFTKSASTRHRVWRGARRSAAASHAIGLFHQLAAGHEGSGEPARPRPRLFREGTEHFDEYCAPSPWRGNTPRKPVMM